MMKDEHKICFIVCVSDYKLAFKSLESINSLAIPSGYTLERHLIQNAPCLTQGYNDAMNSSNAKYKVYLHQDVLILNHNFLYDIIFLFRRYHLLGLLGVVGARIIPPNGIWWESPTTYGKIWDGNPGTGELKVYSEIKGEFATVKVVDGLIMITQVDLQWRTDLFHGWHFYDISQSLEFVKRGFQVGVPNQPTPWCIHMHHNVNMSSYELERQIFLREYGCFIG